MQDDWPDRIKQLRMRHALSQARLGAMLGVAQRTISRWERGQDSPGLRHQIRLRDLGWQLPSHLVRQLSAAVYLCPAARALSRTPRLTLQALSQPAIAKRPSIVASVGQDLAALATGVLRDMLDDRGLQRAVQRGEIASVVAVSGSVLRTPESATIGNWHTTIAYYFDDGVLFSDAISVPAAADAPLGFRAIARDDNGASTPPRDAEAVMHLARWGNR